MSTEERVAALEARIESLATKEDIVRLETRMDALESNMATKKDIAELKGFIQESISQSEIKTLKQFVAFWVVIAGLSIPILSGVFSFVFNTLTLR